VEDWHPFRDADHELEPRVRGLEDRVGRVRRRHVDHAHRGARRLLRIGDRVEHRQTEMLLAAAARRDAGDDLGAVVEALLRVERALLAGEPLADHLGVAVDQDAHDFAPASFTTFDAASLSPVAGVMVKPLFASRSRPLSTFVPSSRTTTGTLTPTCFTAVMVASWAVLLPSRSPRLFTRA